MNVALIPVRGGSKSIPLKNIKEIAGKPLVYWTVQAAQNTPEIDKIYVSTDHERIKEIVEAFSFSKVEVIERGKETATDTASTESVMIEFAQKYLFDTIVLIQATSPLLKSNDLSKGIKLFKQPDTDSVLSVVKQKRFIWEMNGEGYAEAKNYKVNERPRRQEFDGFFVENGAFYITSRESLLQSACRISGRIKMVEMSEETYYEIDEPSDWDIIENLLLKETQGNIEEKRYKAFFTDCDGCLTDGGMYYDAHGNEMKKFNATDGKGFQILREKGILTGIITGEDTDIVVNRAKKLKVDVLEKGVQDKLEVIEKICKQYGMKKEEIVYVGDDINDLDVIKAVGYGCCVNNSVDIVKKASKYITKRNGGSGAVREIVDKLFMNE